MWGGGAEGKMGEMGALINVRSIVWGGVGGGGGWGHDGDNNVKPEVGGVSPTVKSFRFLRRAVG
jgi:hypothetical protein